MNGSLQRPRRLRPARSAAPTPAASTLPHGALPAPLRPHEMFNHLEKCSKVRTDSVAPQRDEHGGRDVAFPEEGILEEFAMETPAGSWRSRQRHPDRERVADAASAKHDYSVYRLIEVRADCGSSPFRRCISRPARGLLAGQRFEDWKVTITEGDSRKWSMRRRQVPRCAPRLRQRAHRADPRSFEHVLRERKEPRLRAARESCGSGRRNTSTFTPAMTAVSGLGRIVGRREGARARTRHRRKTSASAKMLSILASNRTPSHACSFSRPTSS